MKSLLLSVFLIVITASSSPASDVSIEKARFNLEREGVWTVSVTLRHADEGWKHYADEWRVVNAGNDKILGSRTLMHPHVNEQPFTRSLSGVPILANVRHVYIEAHDKAGGWSPQKLNVDMSKKKGERYEINR
ncbi:hypothetical protein MNBD_NITROSPINAE04-1698 [hydrothermal vent metagenome]|uniref:Uncharacterized protein n=1 Tax=hydrothermal vent metagenome TaxID=652676 RepID=A0A3B1CGW1_9ZZZZ